MKWKYPYAAGIFDLNRDSIKSACIYMKREKKIESDGKINN